MERWLTVWQEGDVEEYERRFIQIASNVEEEFSEEFLIANFIKGLEDKIQVELRLMEPATMEEALDWAVKIEEKLMVNGQLYRGGGPKIPNNLTPTNTRTYTYHKANSQNNPTHFNTKPTNQRTHYHPQNSSLNQTRQENTRKLTEKEFQEK